MSIPRYKYSLLARLVEDMAQYVEASPPPVVVPPAPTLPPLSNKSRVRVNLGLANSSSPPLYADAMKQARPLGVDTGGDPLAQIVFVGQKNAGGEYKVYRDGVFEGNVVTVAPGQTSLTIKPGVGKVELIRPGCKRGDIFTPAALAQLAPFGGIRCMDLTATNGSKIVKWSDRPTLDSETWERPGYGAPLEVCIALANQTGKDIWLNIPHAADDWYVEMLGDLVNGTLRHDVNCYIELGNELWNSAPPFNVARDYWLAKADAAIAAGDKTILEPNGSTNRFNSQHRVVARRTVEIAKLLGSDFKIILSNQNGYTPAAHWPKHQMAYIAAHHGEPKQFIHALASAPYGGIGNVDPKPEMRVGYRALATQYGLKYFGYESGFHDENGGQAMLDAHASPAAGVAAEKYLNNLLNSGLDEVYWYTLASHWSEKYVWGLANGTPGAGPKFDGAAKVARERLLP